MDPNFEPIFPSMTGNIQISLGLVKTTATPVGITTTASTPVVTTPVGISAAVAPAVMSTASLTPGTAAATTPATAPVGITPPATAPVGIPAATTQARMNITAPVGITAALGRTNAVTPLGITHAVTPVGITAANTPFCLPSTTPTSTATPVGINAVPGAISIGRMTPNYTSGPLAKTSFTLNPTGSGLVSSIGLVPTTAVSSPGTYINFTIRNGELKQCNSKIVRDLKDPINTSSSSTFTSSGASSHCQKPIIVTVAGIQAGVTTSASSAAQQTNKLKETSSGIASSHKINAEPAKLNTFNISASLSANSSLITIPKASGGGLMMAAGCPIVVANNRNNPPTLCKANLAGPGIINVTPILTPPIIPIATTKKTVNSNTTTGVTTMRKSPILISMTAQIAPNASTATVTPATASTIATSSTVTTAPASAITTSCTAGTGTNENVPEMMDTTPAITGSGSLNGTVNMASTNSSNNTDGNVVVNESMMIVDDNVALTSDTTISNTTTTATIIDAATATATATSVTTNAPVVTETVVSDKTDPNSSDFDPILAMDWNDGIATLPGSNLKFKLNEFGTLEIINDEHSLEMETSGHLTVLSNSEATPMSASASSSGAPLADSVTEMKPTPKSPSLTASRKRKIGRQPAAPAPPAAVKNETIKSDNPDDGDEDNMDQIQCCENCGTYGLREEFYEDSRYCCKECFIVASKKKEFKRKRLELTERKKMKLLALSEPQPPSPVTSEDDTNKQVVVPDDPSKTVAPIPNCKKFFWTTYLEQEKSVAAPVTLFSEQTQNFPSAKNLFRVGMKLEGIDPRHPSLFCVLTVVEVVGFRMRLHFDGYSDCYDFWTNADSSDIFPVGFCEKTGHKLYPPKGYTFKNFNWTNYLKVSKSIPAPRNFFLSRAIQNLPPHTFRMGMKLEAVDKKNSSLVCVATVTDIMKTRFLVHFDGWDDMYDYWAQPDSPYIHPIKWCKEMGHVLTPPNNYKDPNHFDWDVYLKETKTVAVSSKCFKMKSPQGFKVGMKLEAVDRRNAMLVRVATIVDVQPYTIKIHFDGWSDAYDYWVDDDSPDIHPVCWCFNAGFPLQPPINYADSLALFNSNLDSQSDLHSGCPTPGCMGIGHIKGPKFTSHHSSFGCPYSQLNMNKDNSLSDRLGTARNGDAVFIEPLVKKSEAGPGGQEVVTPIPRPDDRFRRCPTPGCNGAGHVTGKYTVHHRVSGCPIAEKKTKERLALAAAEKAAAAAAVKAKNAKKREIIVEQNVDDDEDKDEEEDGGAEYLSDNASTALINNKPDPKMTNSLVRVEIAKLDFPTQSSGATSNNSSSNGGSSGSGSATGDVAASPDKNSLASIKMKMSLAGKKMKMSLKKPPGRAPATGKYAKINNNSNAVSTAGSSSGTTAGDTTAEAPKRRGRKKKKGILPEPPSASDDSKSSSGSLNENVHKSVFTSTSIFHPSSLEETSLCWNQHTLLLPGITSIKGYNVKKWSASDVASFIAGLTGNCELAKKFKEEQIDGEAFLLLTQLDLVRFLTIKLGPALKIYNCLLTFRKTLEDI